MILFDLGVVNPDVSWEGKKGDLELTHLGDISR